MSNWIDNRLSVKNTCPEYEWINAVFCDSNMHNKGSAFIKIYPPPSLLISRISRLRKFIEFIDFETKIRRLLGDKNQKILTKAMGFEWRPDYVISLANFLLDRVEEINLKQLGFRNFAELAPEHWRMSKTVSGYEVISTNAEEFCIEFKSPLVAPIAIYKRLNSKFPDLEFIFSYYSDGLSIQGCGATLPNNGLVHEAQDYVYEFKVRDFLHVIDANLLAYSKSFQHAFLGNYVDQPKKVIPGGIEP